MNEEKGGGFSNCTNSEITDFHRLVFSFFGFLRRKEPLRYKVPVKERRSRVYAERLESERWRDVIKLILATRRLTQGWPCDPEWRLVQGEELFFS